MRYRRVPLILMFLFWLDINCSFAGTIISSGGELPTFEANPWFIGTKPVEYCIKPSSDFSVPKHVVSRIIRSVIDEWTKTITALKPLPTENSILDGARHTISTQFFEVNCSKDVDLTFLLGERTPLVEESLVMFAQYTVAFAKQTHFDYATGRAQGFVWIVPDKGSQSYLGPRKLATEFWSDLPTLTTVIQHEVGHLFGFPHLTAGIMEAELPARSLQVPREMPGNVRNYEIFGWDRLGKSVCGRFDSSGTTAENFFGFESTMPFVHGGTICLKSASGPKSATLFLTLNSIFMNPSEIKLKLYRKSERTSLLRDSVHGFYPLFRDVVFDNAQYLHRHVFVDLSTNDVIGEVEIKGRKVLVQIQTFADSLAFMLHVEGEDQFRWFKIKLRANHLF